MNYDAAKKDFDRDGFAIVRQFLTKDEMSQLASQLERYVREVVPGLSDAHAFYQDRARPETLKQMQFMQVDSFFHDYTQHPKWMALAATLVGESAECESPEWFNKPPGLDHPTPPHQDNYYFNLKPPNVVTIWLALDIVDDENGCLRYVTDSHRAADFGRTRDRTCWGSRRELPISDPPTRLPRERFTWRRGMRSHTTG